MIIYVLVLPPPLNEFLDPPLVSGTILYGVISV